MGSRRFQCSDRTVLTVMAGAALVVTSGLTMTMALVDAQVASEALVSLVSETFEWALAGPVLF